MAAVRSPIDARTIGAVAVGTSVWQTRAQVQHSPGLCNVTVVAKLNFAIVNEAVTGPAEIDELVREEVHHLRNPMRSVRLTSDFAPYIPRADVLLTGHACAPRGRTSTGMNVRLAVIQQVSYAGSGSFHEQALIDKTIFVRGDTPFDKIPLVYERAHGGIGFEQNPLGVGATTLSPGSPNLVDPNRPDVPACFGPISRGWPARKRLLGDAARKQLDLPIAEIPERFDWTYFHAAPPDQRTHYLRGDEWLVLEGFSDQAPLIRTRLPGVRAEARVFGLGAASGQPVVLCADTLRIDMDRLRCSLVFRGSVPVPHERALAAMRIVAAFVAPGQEIDWQQQEPPPIADERTTDLRVSALIAPTGGGTLALADDAPELGASALIEDRDDEPARGKGGTQVLGDQDDGPISSTLPKVNPSPPPPPPLKSAPPPRKAPPLKAAPPRPPDLKPLAPRLDKPPAPKPAPPAKPAISTPVTIDTITDVLVEDDDTTTADPKTLESEKHDPGR